MEFRTSMDGGRRVGMRLGCDQGVRCDRFRVGRSALATVLRSGQLQQVVYRTDQAPLAPNLGQPAQQELAKSPRLLDLPEHRLRQLLAQAVARAPIRTLPSVSPPPGGRSPGSGSTSACAT